MSCCFIAVVLLMFQTDTSDLKFVLAALNILYQYLNKQAKCQNPAALSRPVLSAFSAPTSSFTGELQEK